MGNVFGEDIKPKDCKEVRSAYLTEQEYQRLTEFHQGMFVQNEADSALNNSYITESFHMAHIANVDMRIAEVMKRLKSMDDFEAFVIQVTRKTSHETIQVFWDMIEKSERTSGTAFWTIVLDMALRLIVDSCDRSGNDCVAGRLDDFAYTSSRAAGIPVLDGEGSFNFDALDSFVNNYMPHTARALETFFSVAFFRATLSPSYKPFLCPQLSTPSEIASVNDLLPLALHSEALQGQWTLLYSTSVDGLSFNRVIYHCLGYDGPTCVLIRCQDAANTVIGAVTYDRWKDSNRFFGSSKNALFVLSPRLRIYRGKGASNGAYQWLNTKASTLPRGLGFGGTAEGFRLFVPESLERCTAADACPTYETGPLLPDGAEQFEIHTLEVWGCGGREAVAAALQAQRQERAIADENIVKARQVDKAQFFNNEFDREFFLSNTTSYAGSDRMGNA